MLSSFMLLCLLATQGVFTAGKNYHRYHLLGVQPTTIEDVENLKVFLDSAELDVWTEVRLPSRQVTFLVPPHKIDYVKSYISDVLLLPVEDLRPDVGRDVQDEKNRLEVQRAEALVQEQRPFNISDFNTYQDMMDQLDVFTETCIPGFACATSVIGTSYEGRDIKLMSIQRDPDDESRPVIWIDSLIHAREWITGTTTMNIIDLFLTEYGSNPDVTRLLYSYDWYFVPVVNPDGYEFTWTDDRFWRKSRNINEAEPNCPGTDLNRNFDQQWLNAGASTLPCNDLYAGSSAGSEPETQVIQNQSLALGPRVFVWLSMHAAAEMWLHPYGSIDDQNVCERAADHDDLYQAAEAAAIATQQTWNQTTWGYGNICETIYPASGSEVDYAYAKGGIKYSYTPELSGSGFDPPPSWIPYSFEETWNGIVALIQEIEGIEGNSVTISDSTQKSSSVDEGAVSSRTQVIKMTSPQRDSAVTRTAVMSADNSQNTGSTPLPTTLYTSTQIRESPPHSTHVLAHTESPLHIDAGPTSTGSRCTDFLCTLLSLLITVHVVISVDFQISL